MAWPDDPLPAIRHELHFGDRLVRCFVERPRSLYDLLQSAALRDPDALALIDGDARLTYGDLAAWAGQLAAGMTGRGVRAGDRVALLLGNRAEFVVALFAAARLGAIAVLLSIRERGAGLRDMLVNAGPRLLLYEADLADRLPEPASLPGPLARVPVGGAADPFEALSQDGTARPAPHRPEEEDVAVIIYTAGTTGRPKGAMLTHLNISHSVMHYALCRGLGRDDRALIAAPLDHAIGLIALLLTMVHVGGSTVLMRAFKARPFLQLMAAERVTVTGLVPAMYQLCLLEPDFAAFDLSSWRIGGCGGAAVPEALIARLAERLPNLQFMNGYGATKSTAAATQMPPGRTTGHLHSAGQVVPCAELRIMDEAGRELAPEQAGEIWIRGPTVVPGYFANDSATRAAFVAGFWRSGDIGAIDEAGCLHVLDRLKDMINRGGHKVFSAELESVLSEHPQVIEAAVVARPDPVLGEKAHAFVTVRGEHLDADALRVFCRARLADYKVPDFVTIGAEPLPRNTLGKLQKNLLRQRAAAMSR